MRQHMPGTSTEPEVARRYAAGEASFDDIAEDMGPREATTLDMLFDAQGFRARVREMNAADLDDYEVAQARVEFAR